MIPINITKNVDINKFMYGLSLSNHIYLDNAIVIVAADNTANKNNKYDVISAILSPNISWTILYSEILDLYIDTISI